MPAKQCDWRADVKAIRKILITEWDPIGCGVPDFDNEGRIIRADFGDKSVFSVYFPSGTSGDLRQEVKYKFLDFISGYLKNLKP